jgi:hypothetical protein
VSFNNVLTAATCFATISGRLGPDAPKYAASKENSPSAASKIWIRSFFFALSIPPSVSTLMPRVWQYSRSVFTDKDL